MPFTNLPLVAKFHSFLPEDRLALVKDEGTPLSLSLVLSQVGSHSNP